MLPFRSRLASVLMICVLSPLATLPFQTQQPSGIDVHVTAQPVGISARVTTSTLDLTVLSAADFGDGDNH